MTNSLKLYETSTSIIGSNYATALTVKHAFENSTNIQKLVREKGQEYPVAIITKLLSDSLFYVKHKLESSQMAAFANMFVINNPTLTIDEVVFLLTKGINGQYGKTYGDFDYMVLCDWREKYESGDRAIYIENKNYTAPIGDTRRRSATGEKIGDIAKDSIAKLNEGKSKFKENDALKDYKKGFKK